MGQFISRRVVASGGTPTTLTWSVVPIDLFPSGAHDLENAVIQEKAWAIIASACHMVSSWITKFTHQLSQPKCDGIVVIAADDTYVANRSVNVYVTEARSENA